MKYCIDENRILLFSLLISFYEENVQFFELTSLDSDNNALDRDILPFCRFYYGNRKRGLLGTEEDPSVTNKNPELIWEISQRLSKRLASEVSILPIDQGYKLGRYFNRLHKIGVSETDILRIHFNSRSKANKLLADEGYLDFLDGLEFHSKCDLEYSVKTIDQLKREIKKLT
jgi:hypothetical protein